MAQELLLIRSLLHGVAAGTAVIYIVTALAMTRDMVLIQSTLHGVAAGIAVICIVTALAMTRVMVLIRSLLHGVDATAVASASKETSHNSSPTQDGRETFGSTSLASLQVNHKLN